VAPPHRRLAPTNGDRGLEHPRGLPRHRAYQQVVCDAEATGYDTLCDLCNAELARLLRPIGLTTARITYLRSLGSFPRFSGGRITWFQPS
jgi:hypothetical protein